MTNLRNVERLTAGSPDYEFDAARYRGDLQPFAKVLDHERQHPQGEDPFVAAYAEAMLGLLSNDQMIRFLDGSLEYRNQIKGKPLTPTNLVNLTFRVFHRQMLKNDPAYPHEDYLLSETYEARIVDVLNKPEHRELADYDMIRDVQSNIAARYAVDKIIVASEVDRFGSEIKMLDVGSGALLGPAHLASNLPFDKIKFGRIDPTTAARVSPDLIQDPRATKVLNSALKKEAKFVDSIGVDPVDMHDPANWEWSQACSARPLEIVNGKKIRTGIVDCAPPRLQTQQPIPTKGWDLVTCHTMPYLLAPKIQKNIFQILSEYVRDDGLVVVQDYAFKKSHDQLQFFKKLTDFRNRTFVSGLRDSGAISELFLGRTGRYSEIALGKDIGHLAISDKFVT
jgi:hypothetical protein